MSAVPDLGDVLRRHGPDALEEMVSRAERMSCPPAEESEEPRAPLPRFPLEVLAPGVREAVESFAASVQAPTELAALPALAVAATALGPRWRVGPAGFVRPPLLWFVVVAPSGTSKTPAAHGPLRPLYAADRLLREEHALARGRHQREQRERRRSRSEEPGSEMPARRHLVVSDATPEALEASLAAADGHGLLAHADELPRLLGGMGGYSQSRAGAGRAAWLTCWSGQPIRVQRRSREPLEADRPHLCVYAGIQPERLASVGLSEGDGLLARFLFALVEPRPHGLGSGEDPRVAERWDDLVRRALALEELPPQPFEERARALLNDRMLGWTARAAELGALGLGLTAATYAKAADHAVRLAALLHGLDALDEGPPLVARPVPCETLERALALLDHHLEHGAAVARLVVSPPEDPAKAADTDAKVASALRAELVRGQAQEDTPSAWATRLRARGLPLSPEQVGKVMRRLAADPRPGLKVERPPRGASRRWRVTRE
ncbi:MAG: DUF3987 domain-containing protein [Planctomycetota bacterium]